jgi:hypothetical protein
MSEHAPLTPSAPKSWRMKSGKAAPADERTMVSAAKADAVLARYVSTRYV